MCALRYGAAFIATICAMILWSVIGLLVWAEFVPAVDHLIGYLLMDNETATSLFNAMVDAPWFIPVLGLACGHAAFYRAPDRTLRILGIAATAGTGTGAIILAIFIFPTLQRGY